MKNRVSLLAALALAAASPLASARQVTAQCGAVIGSDVYYSDVFPLEVADDFKDYDLLLDITQDDDFAEYLRRHHGATGKETVSCELAREGKRTENATVTFNGPDGRPSGTLQWIQTGYVPKDR